MAILSKMVKQNEHTRVCPQNAGNSPVEVTVNLSGLRTQGYPFPNPEITRTELLVTGR